MSVFKRKTSKGESEFYYYRITVGGIRKTGVCKECRTKREAEKFEKEIKEDLKDITKHKTAQSQMEQFVKKLTGSNAVLLNDAFELFLKKPRKSSMSLKQRESKRSYWNDFLSFLQNRHPELKKLSDVRKLHAEEYINQLRTHGRYNKTVSYKTQTGEAVYERKHNLSPRTCNVFHNTMREVFTTV
jgi:hypothetical protein